MAGYTDWETAVNELKKLETDIGPRYDASKFDRQPTFLHIIRALRQYAEGQFRFFFQGFGMDMQNEFSYDPYPPLEPASRPGPDDVLTEILGRIQDDLKIIDEARKQRKPTAISPISPFSSTLPFLQAADKLAATALWPGGQPDGGNREGFTLFNDFHAKTVLTYFVHDPEADAVKVRLVPYAQVAMIGIPYAAIDNLEKLLAIPHEVGHFLFWYSYCEGYDHSTRKFSPSQAAYRNTRERYFNVDNPDSFDPQLDSDNLAAKNPWAEEIFADVYGTLIGGPLFILGAIKRAFEPKNLAVFTDFDNLEKHPTPVIRPLIQMKAMLNMPGQLWDPTYESDVRQVVSELLQVWNNALGQNSKGDYVYDAATDKIPGHSTVNTELNKHMSPVFSPGLTALRVDEYINRSFKAIQAIFNMPQTIRSVMHGPIVPLVWGWPNPDLPTPPWKEIAGLQPPSWDQVADFVDQEPIWIDYLMSRAPDIHEELDRLFAWEPVNFDGDKIPPLWLEWAVTAKKYLRNQNSDQTIPPLIDLSPSGQLDRGEWDYLNPPADDVGYQNFWIRVYGSGGWSTKGPCTSPGRP